MSALSTREELLEQLGFRFGLNGPHAARTMMLGELRALMRSAGSDATPSEFATAVVRDNVLGKPSRKARELTLRHLRALYGLDSTNPIFRALARLWPLSEAAQPMLALVVALARDPLLRATKDLVLDQTLGTQVGREAIERCLSDRFPDRFSPASLRSFAQNVGGTWSAGGLLAGRRTKVRVRPTALPESLTLAMFLGYLEGRLGQRLFSSEWMKVLGGSVGELDVLTQSAANRGLLVFMNAGGIREVRFPGYLTPQEEAVRGEVALVL